MTRIFRMQITEKLCRCPFPGIKGRFLSCILKAKFLVFITKPASKCLLDCLFQNSQLSDSQRTQASFSFESFCRISKTDVEKIAGQEDCLKNRLLLLWKNHNENFKKVFIKHIKERKSSILFDFLSFCVYMIRPMDGLWFLTGTIKICFEFSSVRQIISFNVCFFEIP